MSNDRGFGKGCLFVVAAGLAVFVGLGIYETSQSPIKSIALGFAFGLIYPILGAGAIMCCEGLRDFAFPDHDDGPWDTETKALMGAIWPCSLLYWLVITPFFAVINRLFR